MDDKDFEALMQKCDKNYETINAGKEAGKCFSLDEAVSFLDEELRLVREITKRRELKIKILSENLKSEINFVNFLSIFAIVASFSCFVTGYYFGVEHEKYNHPFRNVPAQIYPDADQLILEEIHRENVPPPTP